MKTYKELIELHEADNKILLKGFGRVDISQLEPELERRFKIIEKFMKKKDYRNALNAIDSGPFLSILKELKTIQDKK